jgi:hypothetical protein
MPVAAPSNGGSAAIDGELRALDEARAIGREKDNCFGNFLGVGWTSGGRLSGQLLKTFAKRICAFGARGSRTYCIDAHAAWAVFGGPYFRQEIDPALLEP